MLDLQARAASLHGRVLNLKPRALDLLAMLAADPQRLFTAGELKAAVWPGREVDDTNLRMQVQALRHALGRDAVQNLPGRGYRLVMPVQMRQAPGAGGNLPHWDDALLGRDADLAAVSRLLAEHRLVTVLGPGGIGKTRLAQQLARQQLGAYRDGAWWVDLATVPREPAAESAVAQAVAQALNLQTPLAGSSQVGQTLGRLLADWQGLLLLDNAEHLSGSSGVLPTVVQALLAQAPGLRLLVTSQQALKCAREWVYRLDALALPALGETRAEALRASPAVQLLARRARAASQHFLLHDDDLPMAGTVVRQLDGIPLAIEMAASRLPTLGLDLLHRQLDQQLQLLDGSASLPRHRTLQAALDWSHGLLSVAERMALRQLTVFAAPFRLDTACEVVNLPGQGAAEALQAVLGLVDKSLLQPQPEATQRAVPRLRLLASTRQHAEQALRQAGAAERGGALDRHVQAMARVAVRARADFFDARAGAASDVSWQARWGPDMDDLMLAFDRAHAEGDATAAAAIIELLVLAANINGRVDPALKRAAAARALAERADPLPRARLLGWGSNLQTQSITRAEAAAQRVAVWRAVTQQPEAAQGLCTALAMQALVNEEAGDPAAADAALAECRLLEAAAWSPRLRRRCTWLPLSRMALLRDDAATRQESERLSHRLLGELRRLGALREAGIVEGHLAQLLRLQGRARESAALLQRLAAEEASRGGELDAGIYLGQAAAALLDGLDPAPAAGPHPAAEEAAGLALQALGRIAPLPALVRHLAEPLALLACHVGEPAQAAVLLAAADRLRSTLRNAADPMAARTAQLVREALGQALSPARLQQCAARGQTLDADALRLEALAWLRTWVPRQPG